MEKVFESAGYLLNGIEVYSTGLVIQGSERAAYSEGGSSFSEENRRCHHVPKGTKMYFDVTPSYNSLAEFCGVCVEHRADGSIKVTECDEEVYCLVTEKLQEDIKEDEKVTFVTQNTEVRAGGRLFIWYQYFNESRDYVPGTLTQSIEELFSDEQCKELTANSYEDMERAVDDVLEGYSE